MKLIALDTSTKFLCLGLYDNGTIYEYRLEVGMRLSTLLAPTIERLTKSLGWDLKDVDFFACGLGPGSFTGVRVGMAMVKGLAWSLGKKVIGVGTLDVLAQAMSTDRALALALIDAKRGLVYAGIYKTQQARSRRVGAYMLLPYEQIVKKVLAEWRLGNKPDVYCCGDALSLYADRIVKDLPGIRLLDKDYWYPAPRHLISRALALAAKARFKNASDIKPMYLYPKECQIRKI